MSSASDTTNRRGALALVCSSICSNGTEGPTGPTGPAGPAGPAGPPGGRTGTATAGSFYSMSNQIISSSTASPTIIEFPLTFLAQGITELLADLQNIFIFKSEWCECGQLQRSH
jgi:hypothetical protein